MALPKNINTKDAAAITFSSVSVSATALSFTQLPNIACDEVIFSGNGPGATVQGSVTTAGIVATLAAGGPSGGGYTILLDGTSVATAALSVSVQVLDPSSGTYVTPSGVGNPNVADPVSIAIGGITLIQIPDGCAGVQINVPSFGTSTGTFRGVITANGIANLAVAGSSSPGNNYLAVPCENQTPLVLKTAGNSSNLWVASVVGNVASTLGFMAIQYRPVF